MRIRPILAVLALMPCGLAQNVSAQKPPYTLEEVITLVQGGHPAARLVSRIADACISFRVDANAGELRAAGASDSHIAALRNVCYKAPRAAAPAPSPSAARGFVVIQGELPPGWSRRVNKLAPNTNREIDMTPGWRNIVIVTAPGWCPATTEITVEAGERKTWRPMLQPRPWVGDCPENG